MNILNPTHGQDKVDGGSPGKADERAFSASKNIIKFIKPKIRKFKIIYSAEKKSVYSHGTKY